MSRQRGSSSARAAGPRRYVSRGGQKLAAALDSLEVQVGGLVCADLGSHVGGFADCLLDRGARRVYAVDTCYGTLAWRLRRDPRIVVRERTNALHLDLPEAVDLVTVDVGWTPQRQILPRARTLIQPAGRILSLVKPQYEAREGERCGGVLRPECLEPILARLRNQAAGLGLAVRGQVASRLLGHGGNREVFLLLVACGPPARPTPDPGRPPVSRCGP